MRAGINPEIGRKSRAVVITLLAALAGHSGFAADSPYATTLIVNGKYSTSASLAGGNPQLMQVVDFLVQQEREQAMAAPAPAAAAVGQ